jgi:hypothetical protein
VPGGLLFMQRMLQRLWKIQSIQGATLLWPQCR